MYGSLSESVRLSRHRVVQQNVLHLGDAEHHPTGSLAAYHRRDSRSEGVEAPADDKLQSHPGGDGGAKLKQAAQKPAGAVHAAEYAVATRGARTFTMTMRLPCQKVYSNIRTTNYASPT